MSATRNSSRPCSLRWAIWVSELSDGPRSQLYSRRLRDKSRRRTTPVTARINKIWSSHRVLRRDMYDQRFDNLRYDSLRLCTHALKALLSILSVVVNKSKIPRCTRIWLSSNAAANPRIIKPMSSPAICATPARRETVESASYLALPHGCIPSQGQLTSPRLGVVGVHLW